MLEKQPENENLDPKIAGISKVFDPLPECPYLQEDMLISVPTASLADAINSQTIEEQRQNGYCKLDTNGVRESHSVDSACYTLK